MDAHQRLFRAGKLCAFGVAELGEPDRRTRVDDRMEGAQVVDLRLQRIGKRIVGCAHVGVLGLAAAARHLFRREHRVARARTLERRVGVPEPVAQRVHPPAVVAVDDRVVLIEVRDVGEPFVLEPLGGSITLRPTLVTISPPPSCARTRPARRPANRCSRIDQHRVPVHQRAHLVDSRSSSSRAHVDAGHLAGEQRMQRSRQQRRGLRAWSCRLRRLLRPRTVARRRSRRRSRALEPEAAGTARSPWTSRTSATSSRAPCRR